MDNIKIGLFLQSLRKEKNLTQGELAQEFDISNKTVSKWECGDTLPEVPLLKKIAEYYDITVDEILNGQRNNSIINNDNNTTIKEEPIKENNDNNLFLPLIISIFSAYIVFLLSLAIGYGITNGAVCGIVGIIGGVVGFFVYFTLAYYSDKDFYKNKNNKHNILIMFLSLTFEIIISSIMLYNCDNESILLFKVYFVFILRAFSIFGSVSLMILLIINEKKNKLDFIFGIMISLFTLLFNLYCNLAPVFSFEFELALYDDLEGKYSLYSNMFEDDKYKILFMPLGFGVISLILSYIFIYKGIKLFVPLFVILGQAVTTLISFIYIIKTKPSFVFVRLHGGETELYIAGSANIFLYVFMVISSLLLISYAIFVTINYIKKRKNELVYK